MEPNCIYALFCFEICFYNSNAVELNKNKSPKAGEAGSDDPELQLLISSKYPTVLILWTVLHVDATDAAATTAAVSCVHPWTRIS